MVRAQNFSFLKVQVLNLSENLRESIKGKYEK